MIKKPLISVIIPVYNAQKRLALAIESIKNQTYQNFELILINDGSTDGSAKICDAYAKTDSRIQVIHQENKRVSAARNRGIDAASGDYLIFVDGDDEIEALTFERCLKKFETVHLDLVIFGMSFDYYKDGKRQKSEKRTIEEEIYFKVTEIKTHFFDLANQNYLASACNKMIRSTIIKNNQLYFEVHMSILEDFKFVLDVLEKSQTICATPSVFYHYYHDLRLSQMKRRPVIDYFRNFQILDCRLRTFSQTFDLDAERNGARIEGMIFRYYLTAVEKIYSGAGRFLEKYRKMKKLMDREEVKKSGQNAQVSGFRLRLVLFLFHKKFFRLLALLFFLNDWRAQFKKS